MPKVEKAKSHGHILYASLSWHQNTLPKDAHALFLMPEVEKAECHGHIIFAERNFGGPAATQPLGCLF